MVLSVHTASAETEAELAARLTAKLKEVVAALPADLVKKNTFPFGGPEHREWHWIPSPYKNKYGPRGRSGVAVEDMNERQIALLHEALKIGLSGEGYRKMQLVIRQEGKSEPRQAFTGLNRSPTSGTPGGPDWYFLTIFGEVGGDPWAWRFEGHHVSLTWEIIGGGKVRFSPSMIGFNPSPLPPRSAELAMNLFHELPKDAREQAHLVKEGKGIPPDCTRTAAAPKPVGARLSNLNDEQRWYLLLLLEEYIGNYPDVLAKPVRKEIHSKLNEITFAWWGPLDHAKEHFYRLQGPSFLIEMRHQGGGSSAAHIHGVYRSLVDGSVNSTVAGR
jgi:hypothetical protein